MKVETRIFDDGKVRQLLLIAESEEESSLIDFVLSGRVPNDQITATRQLADGYCEDYLRLVAK